MSFLAPLNCQNYELYFTCRSLISKRVSPPRYNDEPHGVFGILPEYQTVVVDPVDLTRHVRLNFTRFGGRFGNVILTFSLKYDIVSGLI